MVFAAAFFSSTVRSPKREVTSIKPNSRVNEQIRAREVRLIDAEGGQIGIVPIEEAMRRAAEVGLDLVEVAPEARPPVCRIFDYRKILYELKRRQKESRKKTHQVELKEVKVRVTIDRHDLGVKTKQAHKFLDQGHKVKLTIQYRGREITKQALGAKLVEQFLGNLVDIADVEQPLTRQGRQQHMILGRRKDYVPQKSASESPEPSNAASPPEKSLAEEPPAAQTSAASSS